MSGSDGMELKNLRCVSYFLKPSLRKDTIAKRLDQDKSNKQFYFCAGILCIILSDTDNNNLSRTGAKTSPFRERILTLWALWPPSVIFSALAHN